MAKDAADEMLAAFGASDKHQEVSMWLSTGFAPLDYAISGSYKGGMPVGRIVEMFGPESSGKTAIATQVMIQAQKAGGFAGFNDHERSFDGELAEILGLDRRPGKFLFKTPDTFEDSVTLAIKAAQLLRTKKLIPETAPIVWVFDSLASMVPQSKAQKEITEHSMHDTTALARATSSAFPALASFCEKYGMLALFLNQIRMKPGIAYGDPTTTPGGNAPKFYASVRISLGATRLVKGTGEAKEVIGQEITAKCNKNKVSRPFMKAKWDFMFMKDGTGRFDQVGSLLDYLVKAGLIEKSGAYIKWTDGKSYHKGGLVQKIESEGLYPALLALLPEEGVEVEYEDAPEGSVEA